MALRRAMLDENALRNFREFLETYNKISEVCFSRCVTNIHQGILTSEEALCCDSCVEKNINLNHKILSAFVVEQPKITEKKIAEAQKVAEEMMLKETESNKNQLGS